MSRVLLISSTGMGLPLAKQLQEEGCEVTVYVHDSTPAYDGEIKLRVQSPEELGDALLAATKDTIVLFDSCRPYRATDLDNRLVALRGVADPAREAGIRLNLFGPFAEWLRDERQLTVVGCNKYAETAELNRANGKQLAKQCDLRVPQWAEFAALAGLKAFLSDHDRERWEVRAAGFEYAEQVPGEILERLARKEIELPESGLLVERVVDGVVLEETVWWNGQSVTTPIGSIVRDRMLVDDMGPQTDSALTLTWAKHRTVIDWSGAIRKWLRRAKYLGPVTARFVRDPGGTLWFSSWAIRLSYDSCFGALELLKTPLSKFLGDAMFHGGVNDDAVAATVRVRLLGDGADERQLPVRHRDIARDAATVRWLDITNAPYGGSLSCGARLAAMVVRSQDAREAFKRAQGAAGSVVVLGDRPYYRTDGEAVVRDFRYLSSHQPRVIGRASEE